MTIDLKPAIVRILSSNGATVGTGFVASDVATRGSVALIATCAHVVSTAGAGPGDTVRLVFHATGEEREALVEPTWWRDPDAEDVAILHLEGALPEGVTPLDLGAAEGSANHPFRAFGYPVVGDIEGLWATGEIKGLVRDAQGRQMLQLASAEIDRGISGGPVLDETRRRVVGMVTATYYPDSTTKHRDTGFATPTETLRAACPALVVHLPPDQLDEYREYVRCETKYVTMKGVPLPAGVGQVPLDKVYVQLQAVKRETWERQRQAEHEAWLNQARAEIQIESDGQTRAEMDKSPSISAVLLRLFGEQFYRQGSAYRTDERPEPISPIKAVQEHERLVILGAPGAGKSTLLRYLARQAAKQSDGAIPILVSARDFATARVNDATLSLREFALNEIARNKPELIDALREADQKGQVLWLVDALDEARGEYGFEAAQQAKYLRGQVVVTSRPVGYPGGLEAFPHFEVLPLTPEDVDQFTTDWLDLLTEKSDLETDWVNERVTWLKQALDRQPRLKPLVRNPLLLTFLVILASDKGRKCLPETRGKLYAEYVRQLVVSWERRRQHYLDPRQGERVLTVGELKGDAASQSVLQGFYYLGWRLHLLYYGGKAEQEPDRGHLTEALAAYLGRRHVELLREQAAGPIAEAIVDFWLEAGILDRWDTEHNTFFTFRHLTFQEYAAGVYLAQAWQDDPKATWKWLKPRLHLPTWREPLLLMSSELSQVDRSSLVRRLCTRHPLLRILYPAHNLYEGTLHRGLRLAAAVLGEGQPVEAGPVQRVVRRIAWLGRSHTWQWLLTWGSVLLLGWVAVSAIISSFLGLCAGCLGALVLWPIILWLSYSRIPFVWNIFAFPTRLWRGQPPESFIQALGDIGNADAVHHLVEALGDSEGRVRGSAAEALGDIGDAAAVPRLVEALGDRGVRESAAEALGDIGDAAVPHLVEALGDSDEDVRRSAAWALGHIGDAAAVPYLVAALGDSDEDVRWRTAEALGHIGNAAAVPHLVEALGDSEWRVRGSAAEALGRIGDAAAVPHLVEALGDNEEDVCGSAAEALGEIGDAAAVPHLVAALGDSEWRVRGSAAKALGRIGDAAVSHLVEALGDSERRVRGSAAEALGYIGDAAVPHLVEALGDSDWSVRGSATEALRRIGDAAVPHLVEALDDGDERVRWWAAWALGDIGDAAAVPRLVEALGDSEGSVRESAAMALGDIGDSAVVPHLVEALGDSDWSVRRRAAWALGDIGDSAAVPHLVEALGDSEGSVRESVAMALQSISLQESNRHTLRRLLRRLWWFLTDRSEFWSAMDHAAQRLAIVEAAERPATEIVVHAQPVANRWRAGAGAFLAALGLFLFSLGQDVVSNLLAKQLGPHVPPGLQGVLALVGLGLLLGGLVLIFQRRLSRLAS